MEKLLREARMFILLVLVLMLVLIGNITSYFKTNETTKRIEETVEKIKQEQNRLVRLKEEIAIVTTLSNLDPAILDNVKLKDISGIDENNIIRVRLKYSDKIIPVAYWDEEGIIQSVIE